MPTTRVLRTRFATTQWSLVIAAGGRGSVEAEDALADLCGRYWYPIFAFVRRKGYSPEDAQDLTQSFFARVIEKGYFGDADRNRGRFRTFLLTACQRFLSDERDRANALKRGGGMQPISIDVAAAESKMQRALAHDETPERLYDRQWCLFILGSVLDDLRAQYEKAGNQRVFNRLSPFLTMADDAGTHAEAAQDLGMTATAVKVAVHRLRARYRDALRLRVSETVASANDVEDELRCLMESV
jgi:RNA polymerase sigma-70 factor (ECF subfamily)